MKEYALRFTKLSKYVWSLFVDPHARMSMFVLEISNLVVIECRNNMLVKKMGISWSMTYIKNIEG